MGLHASPRNSKRACFKALFYSGLLLFAAALSTAKAETVRVGVLMNGAETRIQYKRMAYPFLLNSDVEVRRLSSLDIASGKLAGLHVLYISAVRQCNAAYDELLISLNDRGLAEIRSFVADGGTYIGEGIGARLAIDNEALGIAAGEMKYLPYRGISEMRVTEKGNALFAGFDKTAQLFTYTDHLSYFVPAEDVEVLIQRIAFVKANKKPERPVLISTPFRKGRILLCSFSLYKATGFNGLLAQMVDLKKKVRNTYNPGMMTSARRWTEDLLKEEKGLAKILKSALAYDTQKVIRGIKEIHATNHIELMPYVVACLRNQHPEVRRQAAEVLLKRTYVGGIDDLLQTYKLEAHAETKTYLKTVLEKFDLKSPSRTPAFTSNKPIKVAIYSDLGVGRPSRNLAGKIAKALRIDSAIESIIVGAVEVDGGILDKADVVIFPGGGASATSGFLGHRGLEKVRAFVRKRKGGYLGYCAGAYLGTSHYKWSLGLLNAGCWDTIHWARGDAISQIKLEAPEPLFPELTGRESFYQAFMQGPLLVKGKNPELPEYEPVMRFASDIFNRPEISGATPGKDYVIRSKDDSGQKVLLYSGHPEHTPGARYFTPRMVRWLSGKEIVSYPAKFVNNEKFKAFYMLDRSWKERLQENIELLTKLNDEKAILKGLEGLGAIGLGGEFFIAGALRSRFGSVRRKAAELVIDQNVLSAWRDVLFAFEKETDPHVKQQLQKTVDYLTP